MKYEIGARIRKYREMSGFSQKELAQKSVSATAVFPTGNRESTVPMRIFLRISARH
jgi:transcriptional regulator with XRE-family HTH domain